MNNNPIYICKTLTPQWVIQSQQGKIVTRTYLRTSTLFNSLQHSLKGNNKAICTHRSVQSLSSINKYKTSTFQPNALRFLHALVFYNISHLFFLLPILYCQLTNNSRTSIYIQHTQPRICTLYKQKILCNIPTHLG